MQKPYQLLIYANFLLCLFPFCELFSHNFVFVFYFLSNSYHLGSFVLALLILNLTLRHFQSPRVINLLFIGLISFAGAMSDFLFIISASVPLLLTSIFLFKQNKVDLIKINIASIIGIVASLIFLQFLQHNHFLQLDEANSFLDIENIVNSLKEFGYQTYVILAKLDASTVIVVLSFISLALLTRNLYLILFKKIEVADSKKWLIVYSTIMVYSLFASPVLAGNYTGPDTIRYNYHAYILLIILLPYLIQSLWTREKKITFNLNYLLALKAVLVFCFTISISISGNNYFKFQPKKAEIADDFSRATGLKTGAGSYWDAKLITMFSKENVIILCTFENLIPYDHVANSSWFHNHSVNKNRMEIEFNILEGDARLNYIQNLLCKDSEQESKWSREGETYIIHPKYFYNEKLEPQLVQTSNR
jgi:hypothetical protein